MAGAAAIRGFVGIEVVAQTDRDGVLVHVVGVDGERAARDGEGEVGLFDDQIAISQRQVGAAAQCVVQAHDALIGDVTVGLVGAAEIERRLVVADAGAEREIELLEIGMS